MTTESATNLERAARTFLARRDRTAHPDGNFDKAGRWYPSEAETCDCCSTVRSPSRAHPFSYMVHCRTMKHVANLFGVSVTDLRREVRRLDPERAPASPSREGGDRYYKAVKRAADGRLVSIWDDSTEYRLGEEMRQPARQNHGGGFYAYATKSEAESFARSAGVDAPVILRVEGSGQYCRYQSKLAFSRMVPVEIVSE